MEKLLAASMTHAVCQAAEPRIQRATCLPGPHLCQLHLGCKVARFGCKFSSHCACSPGHRFAGPPWIAAVWYARKSPCRICSQVHSFPCRNEPQVLSSPLQLKPQHNAAFVGSVKATLDPTPLDQLSAWD